MTKRKLQAFTLLEMLTVLAIVSIVFGVAVLRFGYFSQQHGLSAQAVEIQSVLTQAQLSAMHNQVSVKVKFTNQGYILEQASVANDYLQQNPKMNWLVSLKKSYQHSEADQVKLVDKGRSYILIDAQGDIETFKLLMIKDDKVTWIIDQSLSPYQQGKQNV